MHGSKNVKFGRKTSYGLRDPGFETRWGLDFPDPCRPTPRAIEHVVQRIPRVKRPRLGVYHPAPSGAGVTYWHSYSSGYHMCLLDRLRDMKQMYQSHGVTSPKTWYVSTTVRNGTIYLQPECNSVQPSILSMLCFLQNSSQIPSFPFSVYIVYCKVLTKSPSAKQDPVPGCSDSILRYFDANRVLRMLFHQPLKFVLFFFLIILYLLGERKQII